MNHLFFILLITRTNECLLLQFPYYAGICNGIKGGSPIGSGFKRDNNGLNRIATYQERVTGEWSVAGITTTKKLTR